MSEHPKAMRPEDITRLFVEHSNAGDADAVAALERYLQLAQDPVWRNQAQRMLDEMRGTP
mgnify:CR=1 FL=1